MFKSKILWFIALACLVVIPGAGFPVNLKTMDVEAQMCVPAVVTVGQNICTWDGNFLSRTVSCPANTVRVGCSGSQGDMGESGEVWRVYPSGPSSCTAEFKSQTCGSPWDRYGNIYAYCLPVTGPCTPQVTTVQDGPRCGGSNYTLRASCPAGTLRIGCSGSDGDMGEWQEQFHLYPTGTDACEASFTGSACSGSGTGGIVTAYCLEL